MARNRAQTIKVRKVRATVGSTSRVFTSKAKAQAWVVQETRGSQRTSIEPIAIAVEDYELKHEHFARENEDPDDPENWTGIRLIEEQFSIYGTAADEEPIEAVEKRLRFEASLRRERSYRRLIHQLHKESLGNQSRTDMPKSAREYASSILARYRNEVDTGREQFETRKRVAALPTIAELHDTAVKTDLDAGRISNGTAVAAKGFAPWRGELGKVRVDKITSDHFHSWLSKELAKKTGGTKRLRNAVGEIARLFKYVRRDKDLRVYSAAFTVEDLRLDLSGLKRADDGAHGRRVFTLDELRAMFIACQTDVERATFALALLGVRTLSEVAGAGWENISQDLGSHWLKVEFGVVDGKKGELFLEEPKDVKARRRKNKTIVRHVPITKLLWTFIEPLRGRGRFVLGEGESIVSPRFVERTLNRLIDRAGFREPGVSPYSFRHTVLDRTEELAGKEFRDLLHRGDDDPSIANRVYTHSDAIRFRKKLFVREGVTCADVMPWAKPEFFELVTEPCSPTDAPS